jgi:hypothetical protein
MMLGDFGARVVRVDPMPGSRTIPFDPFGRDKRAAASPASMPP